MTRKSKDKAQRIHAKRYGVELNRFKYSEICKRIQSGKNAEFLERQSHRVTVWLVQHEDEELICVYDKLRKTIVTVLPQAWLKRYRRRINKEGIH